MALLAIALWLVGLVLNSAAPDEGQVPQPLETAVVAGQTQGVFEGLTCPRPQSSLAVDDKNDKPAAGKPAGPCTVKLRLSADQQEELIVDGAENRVALAQARSKDLVKVSVGPENPPTRITRVLSVSRPVKAGTRVWALSGSLLILLLLAVIVTRCCPQGFLVGQDGRYSNSHVQIVFWFGALVMVYGATLALRYCLSTPPIIGGVGIPQNLLLLSGLSALSFGGAKMIRTSKSDEESARGAAGGAPPAAQVGAQPAAVAEAPAPQVQAPPAVAAEAPAPPVGAPPAVAAGTPTDASSCSPPAQPGGVITPNFIEDLVKDNCGRYDFGDFQMIVVTLAAVAIYVLTGYHYLRNMPLEPTIILPDVDTTLLAGFGLGQGAYLLKKAVSKPGQG